MTLDELLGQSVAQQRGTKRGPASRLQQQIEAVAQLPKAKPQSVSQMPRHRVGPGHPMNP